MGILSHILIHKTSLNDALFCPGYYGYCSSELLVVCSQSHEILTQKTDQGRKRHTHITSEEEKELGKTGVLNLANQSGEMRRVPRGTAPPVGQLVLDSSDG